MLVKRKQTEALNWIKSKYDIGTYFYRDYEIERQRSCIWYTAYYYKPELAPEAEIIYQGESLKEAKNKCMNHLKTLKERKNAD